MMDHDSDGMEDEMDGMPSQFQASEFYAKYEPKEVLGKGLVSTVRRCVEKHTELNYAVKIIDISKPGPEVELVKSDTEKEIYVLGMTKGHPNIIELHDVFQTDTFIFLIFELCTNGELFDLLTQVVTLSEKKTRKIMTQLFNVVRLLHSYDVVHRDLKPENLLLDTSNNIKVSDFGFSTRLEKGQLLKEICGTPGYLAPEVLKCTMREDAPGYSKEVDLWACGVIMYTLLVGMPPFWHRRQIVMLRMIMEGKFTFGSPEWDDISDTAKDLIRRLLVVDPAQRITAEQALQHQFFETIGVEFPQKLKFCARRKLKGAMLCVRAVYRIINIAHRPLTKDTLMSDPYSVRFVRKVIDTCAFNIYGHWIKRGEEQNRAALFENTLRTEMKELGRDQLELYPHFSY